MRPEKPLAPIKWEMWGEDISHKAFISTTPFSFNGSHPVFWLKLTVRKSTTETALDSKRMIKRWEAINPNYPAYKISDDEWMAPCLGLPASDALRVQEVLKIYLNSRYIITYASMEKSFLMIEYENKAMCVDVASAWHSVTDPAISEGGYRDLERFLDQTRDAYPLTTSLIRTLLYIEKHLKPSEIKDTYIIPNMMVKVRDLRLYEVPLTSDIMEACLSCSDDYVLKFAKMFEFLNSTSPLTPDEIKNLLTIIKLDSANEIPRERLREFLRSDPLIHYNAIHMAANLCLFELTKNLITQNPLLSNAKNRYKVSPLHMVLERPETLPQRIRIIELLLEHGGEINQQIVYEGEYHDGLTPLDIALIHGHSTEIKDRLRAEGALTREELSATAEASSREESPAPLPPSAAALTSLGLFREDAIVEVPVGSRPRAFTF